MMSNKAFTMFIVIYISTQGGIKTTYASIQCLLPLGFQAYVIGGNVSLPVESICGTISPPEKILKQNTTTSTPILLTRKVCTYIT